MRLDRGDKWVQIFVPHREVTVSLSLPRYPFEWGVVWEYLVFRGKLDPSDAKPFLLHRGIVRVSVDHDEAVKMHDILHYGSAKEAVALAEVILRARELENRRENTFVRWWWSANKAIVCVEPR